MGQASAIPAHLLQYATEAEQLEALLKAVVPDLRNACEMFARDSHDFPIGAPSKRR